MATRATWAPPATRGLGGALRGGIAVAAALLALAATVRPARAAAETTVRVERVRPVPEKRPTLRFLRENRDFLRAALDRTRERTLGAGAAAAIDPRFLAYRELVAEATAAQDSVGGIAAADEKRDLLRSVTELGALESELDQLDRLLGAQRDRLRVLQGDFTGDQRTALAIVVSGAPGSGAAPLAQIVITLDDGTAFAVPLTAEQNEALRLGGAVQVFHGYVEPRSQVLAIALGGRDSDDLGFVTLDPARDRLTMLRLDVSGVRPDQGVAGLRATTWLNDTRVP